MKKIRFGLCCLFKSEPIKFKTLRYSYLSKVSRVEQLKKIETIILWNLNSLYKALKFCHYNNIGCFRITSTFMPLYTHPEIKYSIEDLPLHKNILKSFSQNKKFAQNNNLRLTLHPDQFTILNSPRPDVVQNSINDLIYHSILADLLGADVINIHLGGAYGNKQSAIERFVDNYNNLPVQITKKITLENDDKSYTPSELLPICQNLKIPLCYDVHHHRCNPDTLSIDEASKKAYETWNREPLFHISSPKESFDMANSRQHSDYIRLEDFPPIWKKMTPLTVEVEGKAKELAIFDLKQKISAL
jgi:UV DNA damage endonuclease